MTDTSPAFRAHVLKWLRERVPDAVEVIDVYSYGTDWEGSTEGGFYPDADVAIRYVTAAGIRDRRSVRGEDMADLWDWVVKGWGKP